MEIRGFHDWQIFAIGLTGILVWMSSLGLYTLDQIEKTNRFRIATPLLFFAGLVLMYNGRPDCFRGDENLILNGRLDPTYAIIFGFLFWIIVLNMHALNIINKNKRLKTPAILLFVGGALLMWFGRPESWR